MLLKFLRWEDYKGFSRYPSVIKAPYERKTRGPEAEKRDATMRAWVGSMHSRGGGKGHKWSNASSLWKPETPEVSGRNTDFWMHFGLLTFRAKREESRVIVSH